MYLKERDISDDEWILRSINHLCERFAERETEKKKQKKTRDSFLCLPSSRSRMIYSPKGKHCLGKKKKEYPSEIDKAKRAGFVEEFEKYTLFLVLEVCQ